MRIIDNNTDFYDYWQGVYMDKSITFDRTDSFLLTKDIMCENLYTARTGYRFIKNYKPHNFVLLQVCNTFWLFLAEITKETDYGRPTDYTIELVTKWKNYSKKRCLIKLDVISFDWRVDMFFYHDKHSNVHDQSNILDIARDRANILVQAIDTNNFRIHSSINRYTIYKGDNTKVEKHIPLLKACGIASCIDSLEIFLAFEEYFSLEKSSLERTASIGITDEEKIENHGFDLRTSFRGKNK